MKMEMEDGEVIGRKQSRVMGGVEMRRKILNSRRGGGRKMEIISIEQPIQ